MKKRILILLAAIAPVLIKKLRKRPAI